MIEEVKNEKERLKEEVKKGKMKTEEEILKKIKELEGKRESGSHDVNERGRPFLFSPFLKKNRR